MCIKKHYLYQNVNLMTALSIEQNEGNGLKITQTAAILYFYT